ncbi:hypothetical protein HMPREF1568_1511 [Providencia alcalifaciens PAL-3]|nr:hypothetical protein HMPREF1568_1511 [Providencia alcalifaciens PAL-3]
MLHDENFSIISFKVDMRQFYSPEFYQSKEMLSVLVAILSIDS